MPSAIATIVMPSLKHQQRGTKLREMCERLGGHLLVIDTEAEQNLFTLQLQIQRRDKAWIDLKRTGKLCCV